MRKAPATRLTVLAALAALLAEPALAQDAPYREVSGWSIYRNAENCSAYMMFENNEAVGFTYEAPGRSTRVTFSDSETVSARDGESPSFDILLRQPDGATDTSWESTVFMVTVDEDGRRTLSSRWLGPPALESFRDATFIGFFDGDREIGVFSLRGTSAALAEVRRCAQRLSAGG